MATALSALGVAAETDWPEFRGPAGNGVVPETDRTRDVPIHFSDAQNVAWKTPIPHQGWSSPTVLENRVWITTATVDGREFFVLCADAESGQLLHNKKLFHADNPEALGNEVNSYASPTPALEPGRVYVHFGSYGTACLNAENAEVLWERQDLPCRHYRGPGSSPIIFEDLLILTFDGVDVQYLAALDKNTGETRWRTDRSTEWLDLDEQGLPKREGDLRKAFTTPLVIEVNGVPLVVSQGSYSAFAYEARTGKEVWKIRNTSFSPAPRPVFGEGVLYLAVGRGPSELWAMRPDGEGDVTDTHTLWKASGRIVPEEPSPLLVDELLYLLSNGGVLTCLEAKTGEEVWSERLGGNHMASPIHADGRIYCLGVQGKVSVVKAGRSPEILATNTFESGFLASPAVVGQALFLRSKTHLYRIENLDNQ